MAKTIKLLCLHGVGHHEQNGRINPEDLNGWTEAASNSVSSWHPSVQVDLKFFLFDDLFSHAPLNPVIYSVAFGKLLASFAWYGIGDLFTHARGLADFPDLVKWTAGMLAQWATEEP